jgi:cysteine-rich repeat protein
LIVQDGIGEECDDGNDQSGDECSSDCQIEVCGDGILQVTLGEECDDGNLDDDDGCNNECARDRVMFASSTWHNGILDGMDGAINICRGLALAADLTGDFYPWLSDAENSPSTLFFRSRGRYVMSDMVTVIADNWDDLTDGTLQNPPAMDENGVWLVEGQVWTNTLTSGEPNPLLQHCDSWSTTAGPGRIGFIGSSDYKWTEPDGTPIPCGDGARLYCVEQE